MWSTAPGEAPSPLSRTEERRRAPSCCERSRCEEQAKGQVPAAGRGASGEGAVPPGDAPEAEASGEAPEPAAWRPAGRRASSAGHRAPHAPHPARAIGVCVAGTSSTHRRPSHAAHIRGTPDRAAPVAVGASLPPPPAMGLDGSCVPPSTPESAPRPPPAYTPSTVSCISGSDPPAISGSAPPAICSSGTVPSETPCRAAGGAAAVASGLTTSAAAAKPIAPVAKQAVPKRSQSARGSPPVGPRPFGLSWWAARPASIE
mmetsp:Transcript_15471/g.49142  ORF Transcript_15471/g.49142 Transcript_15471/m.49142 type:complete len:259 (+) Transcript_15471:70-846(+)